MRTSESINEISQAIAQAQGDIRPSQKASMNPFFKNKYSNITSVWETIREPMSRREICVLQDVCNSDDGVSVTTRLIHCSGQWIEFGPLTIPVVKKDPQGLGSAISYAKRYALCAALGVVSDDDDDDAERVQHVHRKIEENHAKLKKITFEQADQLEKIISKCSDKLKKRVDATLNFRKMSSLEDLDDQLYATLYAAASQDIQEMNSKHEKLEQVAS